MLIKNPKRALRSVEHTNIKQINKNESQGTTQIMKIDVINFDSRLIL